MFYLLLLFTVIPLIELSLLIQAGQAFGFSYTLGFVILTGAVGAYWAKQQGRKVLLNMKTHIERGQLPAMDVLQGIVIFIGGVLLITPGFLTDVAGLGMIFPVTRVFFLSLVERFIRTQIQNGRIRVHTGGPGKARTAGGEPPHSEQPRDPNHVADVIDINRAKQ